MASFDFSTLNVDLTAVTPPLADIRILVSTFKETVETATEGGDIELLQSFCKGIGETRLRGVARRLSLEERASVLDKLLPEITEASSPEMELVQRLLDTAPNLFALHGTMEQVGFHRFDRDPVKKWFGERAALARCIRDLKGEEFLTELNAEANNAEEVIDRVEEILRHNVEVFAAREAETATLPIAKNAQMLLDAFERQKFFSEDRVEFASAWNERVKIHTTTGLGIYDSEELRFTAQELIRIREGLEKFPAHVLALENVVLRMDFAERPDEHEHALGGYHMGRIKLFDTVRTAIAGIDFPNIGQSAETFTTVHEVSHSAHTVCMMDFRKLSGWIDVRNWTFYDPATNQARKLTPDDFQPGATIKIGTENYRVSEYIEPKEFGFKMPGGEDVSIKNPYIRAGCGFLYRESATFVDHVANTQPTEDYAQTLTYFLFSPDALRQASPEKFDFMSFLYGRPET